MTRKIFPNNSLASEAFELVHGYHRLAEKIQQDQLASVQYDFRQQTPDHHSGFTRQQQNSHPERQRHDDRSKAHRNR